MSSKQQYTLEQVEWLKAEAEQKGIILHGGSEERIDHLLDLAAQGVLKLYDQE